MTWKKIWYILSIVCTLALVLYLGYLLGIREKVSSQKDNIELVAANGATENFLTKIESRPIWGSVDPTSKADFGEMLFLTTQENRTQILINLSKVPDEVKQSQNKRKKLPTELNVLLAKRTKDGLDFDYENIGKVILNEPVNGLRSIKFSTIIDKPLYSDFDSYYRIELRPLNAEEENIFKDSDPNLPARVREKPAPYFWINI